MDYGTRIADVNNQIGQAQSNYNSVNQQAGGAYNQFNNALGNVQSYGDIYGQARNKAYGELGVNDARDANLNARNAVDQVNTTIRKLPESIRQQYGGTGLNEAQRQRAMQSQYSDLANTYGMLNDNYQRTSSEYQSLLNQAMAQTSEVAGMSNDNQWRNVGALQNAWSALLGQSNEAYNRILNNRSQLNDVYGQKMTDEQAADELAFNRWKVNQEIARQRESDNARLSLDKYLAGLSNPAPVAPEEYVPAPVSYPKANYRQGNKNVVDDGGWGGLVKQGWQNVKDYGPLALFGGGSLWR